MRVLVTWEQGGVWHPIEEQKPPYKAIMFVHFNDGMKYDIWDCILRRWR